MVRLSAKGAKTPFESVLAHRPELLAGYRAFLSSLWSEGLVPRRILELCRLRVAAIHDCEPEWVVRDAEVPLTDDELDALKAGKLEPFDSAEQAALVVAERMPYQHHQLADVEVEAVKQTIGDAGCVSLLNAVALFDGNCRLKLILDVVPEATSLDQPPLRDGALV